MSLESMYTLDVVLFNLTSPQHRIFYGNWPDKNSRGLTELLVKYISHHPPITPYIIENKAKRAASHGPQCTKDPF